MLLASDTDRAREALQHIPPDLPRDEWVRVLMAAQAAGLDAETVNDWSAQASNYDERAFRDTWRSIKPGKGVGEATLYKKAAEHGNYGKRRERPIQAPARPRKPVEAPRQPSPGMSTAEVWERCKPASPSHGYILAKRGVPDGLRVVPAGDPLKVAGLPMAGALVVPVVPLAGGEPVSLQFIGAPEQAAAWKAQGKPSKLNLPGSPVSGGFVVGDMVRDVEPGDACFIVEGIGQAWACWQATGFPAVVCFGAGRMPAVAAELRQRDPSARLVLVPDRGKEAQAQAIAQDVAGLVCLMPADKPSNYDANDFAQEFGAEELETLLMGSAAPPQRFRLLGGADLQALPPLAWRVRGVLPALGLAALYGPSASGKSFLALDMAAAIAEGSRWFDCRVTAAPVVYAALEGEAGFRLRVQAWEQSKARKLPEGLRMVLQPFKLTDADDVRDLARVVPACAVVFLDTLNRAAPTADENSSRDMGEILEAAKALQDLTGGLVVLVHHTGKDSTRGLRGHSSLFAAMDAAVEVSRDGDRREWKVAKSKDGQDGDAQPFRLEVVPMGLDENGDEITSCVVQADERAEEVRRVKLPQGGNQRVVLEALRPMFKTGHTGKPGAPPLRPCIELEAAILAAGARLSCTSDKRTSRTREAITGLLSRGVLGLNEGWLWLI